MKPLKQRFKSIDIQSGNVFLSQSFDYMQNRKKSLCIENEYSNNMNLVNPQKSINSEIKLTRKFLKLYFSDENYIKIID